MTEIYADSGQTADGVTTSTNDTGHMTPILTFSPDQGTWVRILNDVAQGVRSGLPLFLDLKDGAGNDLPNNTRLVFRVKRAGMTRAVEVSRELKSIAFWNMKTLNEQQDKDQIDNAKIQLAYPEASGQQNADRSHVDVRDIDEFQVCIESTTAVDMSQSAAYLGSDAVEGPYTRA